MYKALLLAILAASVLAATVHVQLIMPEQQDIRNVKITIDSQPKPISPSDKNTFIINDLKEGTYLVEVTSKLFLYEMLNIEVKKDNVKYYSVHPWTRKRLANLDKPKIKPLERINYFEKESSFSLSSLLGNWQVLFILFGGFMLLCYNYVMPKMQDATKAPQVPAARR